MMCNKNCIYNNLQRAMQTSIYEISKKSVLSVANGLRCDLGLSKVG